MKVHGKGRNGVMAVCDMELLGRTLVEENLSFRISEQFFGGKVTERETILRTMAFVSSINVVGERSVSLFVEASIADEDSVRYIDGVPHIQIYIIPS